ncbi:hypothetical protein ABZ912_55760 [Nonomuraea angiospora]|uniref:hypothetical protein n=1 Tax=Nonomuraea angiospora TaxID=46172 RepID=UPI0033DDEC2A
MAPLASAVRFNLAAWRETLEILDRHGPADLIFRNRAAERSDLRGERWPRGKTYDDATAGMRRVRVHATRKTCASLLVALDVHPQVAVQILRHSQIAVTMNIDSEVSSEETRKALKRLGQHLGF